MSHAAPGHAAPGHAAPGRSTGQPLRLASDGGFSERLVSVLVWGSVVSVTAVFVWILGDLLWHGFGAVDWQFLSRAPERAGRAGGVFPIIVSTLGILLIALLAALPPSLATAIWLAEMSRGGGPLASLVGRSLDVLAAVPSIVFGLFGHAFFCLALGMGYSLLAGGLTLACMILPILIRTLEAALRAVPTDYRIAAAALGMRRQRTLFAILLPAALPGLVVGLVLGIGRVLAETAALLFTSGYVDRMPASPMDSGRSLSIHIFDLAMNVPGGETNAYATSVVLVSLLLVINWSAIWLGDRWQQSMAGTRTPVESTR